MRDIFLWLTRMSLETFPLCLQNYNLSPMGNKRDGMRITRGSRFSRDCPCGELPSISLRTRTWTSGSGGELWRRNFKTTGSSPEGATALDRAGTDVRFHEEIYCSTMSFPGCFRLGILRGTKRTVGVKNKLGPRKYSGINRLFASRDKPRLCMDLSVLFFKPMSS